MSSTENLLVPPKNVTKLKGSSQMTDDDLLDQAVGLSPSRRSIADDDEDDERFSFI